MDRLRIILRALLPASVLLTAVSGNALAQSYPAPQASAPAGGNYTVSYRPDCDAFGSYFTCAFTYLQERAGANGAWQNVSSGTGSKVFQNKPQGTYFYRVYVGVFGPGNAYLSLYSDSITVGVGAAPAREPMTAQMAYRYEVRQGDSNGDGRRDLFLRRSSGGNPSDGTLERVVLQQSADGRSFTTLVPTAALASAAAYWPLSSVEAVVADVNVDGYVDVTLNHVSAAVSGADDQIIFASGQSGAAAPPGIRPFDAELGKFTGNMLDYFADQNYFVDHAPYRFWQMWIWYSYCDPWTFTDMDAPYWGYLPGCYFNFDYFYGVYQDFSVFSEEAIVFWANDQDAINGLVDEDSALDRTEQAVEGLLGTPIGGWPMEEVLGQIGVHRDPFTRRGIEIGQSVLGQARGGRNATTSDLVPPQPIRLPDQIYITGHPLAFARNRGHLALEYVDSLGGGIPYSGTTISAEPEHNSIFGFGKLIAKDDRPTDHPLFNYYVGDVDPLLTSNYNYWTGYLSLRHDRYQALPWSALPAYALIPSTSSGTNNSNSYISGITQDSPGRVSISVPFGIEFRYPGWGQPVPDAKFR